LKNSLRILLRNAATLGFIGYLPVAPGTWGSLAALAFMSVVHISPVLHAWFILGVILVGIPASRTAEILIGEKDSGHIVIDEFAGFLVSAFYIPHSYGYLIAAFLLFRIFDILKPFPIRRLEKNLKGGFGIVADDIAAGLYANIILQVWRLNF
jgi:phosphatidylglycerophosphatase A